MPQQRAGIEREVLLSLALVMGLATVVLASVLLAHQESDLRALMGRALLAEARHGGLAGEAFVPGTEWWLQHPGGHVEARDLPVPAPDAGLLALAARARAEAVPLLQPGLPWERIRFAAPIDAHGTLALARLPHDASARLRLAALRVIALVLLADVLIFTAFGARLLHSRVVGPLQRLAGAARAFGAGEASARAPVEGTRETAEVATAFNEMSDALAHRTEELEKAVAELRGANAELRRTRAGLDRAERLASVGRLAAGVAHEIGNPIGAILALLDLARRDPGLSEASHMHLERGAREGERVRRILRQLLDFSRPRRPGREPLDLARVAREAVALVSAQRRYAAVAFGVEVEGEPPLALADAGTVTQVLLNLVLNAADAALEGDDPRVRLCVRGAALAWRDEDGLDADAVARRREPDAVECLVADAGPGIAEDDRERIFDPFFTTKPPGEGTGLGLANAARLAEELEGSVELAQAPPDLRTAFALRLPAQPSGGVPTARNALRTPQRSA